jgi:hypothetical protein
VASTVPDRQSATTAIEGDFPQMTVGVGRVARVASPEGLARGLSDDLRASVSRTCDHGDETDAPHSCGNFHAVIRGRTKMRCVGIARLDQRRPDFIATAALPALVIFQLMTAGSLTFSGSISFFLCRLRRAA